MKLLAGVILGGTVVTLEGLNFQNSTEQRCRFGEGSTPMPTTFLEGGIIKCKSPETELVGKVNNMARPAARTAQRIPISQPPRNNRRATNAYTCLHGHLYA